MSLRHCTPVELIDVVDGVVDEASLPHLAACAACRAQLAEIRDALGRAGSVEVPEPSPLFWDHLSTRVHQAVAGESQPVLAPARGWKWTGWTLALPLGAAAVLLLAVATWRAPRVSDDRGQASQIPSNASVVAGAAGDLATGEPQDDASIGLMMELASTVDLDSAADAGVMTTSSGVTDAAVQDLSSDEQRELERLLKEAIGGA